MNLHVQGFDLPLKHRFTIAHQSREVQETLIVRLEDEGPVSYTHLTLPTILRV